MDCLSNILSRISVGSYNPEFPWGTFKIFLKYQNMNGKAKTGGNQVGPEAGSKQSKINPKSLGFVQKLSFSQQSLELM